jgi:hypothetical protein
MRQSLCHIVQPYASGSDRARHATIISTHDSVEAAYANLDRIAVGLADAGNPEAFWKYYESCMHRDGTKFLLLQRVADESGERNPNGLADGSGFASLNAWPSFCARPRPCGAPRSPDVAPTTVVVAGPCGLQ